MFKNVFLLVACILFALCSAQAQAPSILNYQAVARNSVGTPLPNQTMQVRLSILNGSATGSVVYSEIRSVATNAVGLFVIQIGSSGASSTSGNLSTLNWSNGSKFLKVEIDPLGGSSFIDLGTNQLVSVPYALSASPSGTAGGDLIGTYPNPVLADKAVTTQKIADLSVTFMKLSDQAVTTAKLADGSVTDIKIQSVSGSKVTGNISGNAANVTGTVAVANGGTGAVNATDARKNLGLVIGTDVQAPLTAGKDYLTPTGSAAGLTNFPILNQNTTGNAATVTTNANLTGVVTSVGNATSIADGAITNAMLANGAVAKLSGTNTGDQDLSELATKTALALKANTADVNTSLALKADAADLANKVDKVTGKELSTNDYTTAEKAKLAAITGTNTGDQDLSGLATNTALALKANTSDVNTSLALKANTADVTTSLALKANAADLANKVDKVTGKELSTNDYTTAEKAKLAAITGTNTGDQDLSGLATNTGLALKLNIADTASMLSSRFARDTVSLSRRIDSSIPYTGAAKAADLGAFDLTVNGITVGIGSGKINSNTAIGVNALNRNTTGFNNSAFGNGSLSNNTQGKENTANGTGALFSNTTGSGNTAVGVNAIGRNTSGGGNTAIGIAALNKNTTGFGNTATGLNALEANISGGSNTATGRRSLQSNTTGENNTGTGQFALQSNITGSNNTAVGFNADVKSSALTNATALGNGAIVNASNTIQLGNSSIDSVVTSGKLKTGTVIYPNSHGTNGQILTTSGSGTLVWSSPSTVFTSTAEELGGTTLKSTVTGSSLTSVGTLTNLTVTNPIAGSITGNAATVTTNANLTGVVTSVGNATSIANGAITNAMLSNGAVANLSGTNTGDQTTITGNAGTVTNGVYTVGDQTIAGVKSFSSTIAGSITGNAATVTTNANLTGPVTSVGNATSIANGAITNAMLANGAVANLSGTNTGDQTTITGNAGTVTNGVYTVGDQTIAGVKTFSSTIAGSITGNAATVTTNANLTGVVTSVGNATSIANGVITNAMLANGAVANLSGINTGDNAVNTLYSGLISNATHTGDVTGSTALTIAENAVTTSKIADAQITNAKIAAGAITDVKITDVAATKITGTVAVANGGNGLTSTPANGQIDIGNGAGFTRTTLTAGTGISVTNNAGSITIANTSTLPSASTGDMMYYNGSAWVSVTAGSDGQTLTFIGGRPVWTGSLPANTVVNAVTGKIWMDRNLGATQVATSSTDASAYGDLYQWGRGNDNHQLRTSSTTSTRSGTDTPGNADFILSSDWRSTQNNDLWQGVNGVNNPCPSGYRIPTETEWTAEKNSWSSNNAAGAFSSSLKLPMAGYRSYQSGSVVYAGSYGAYWSSTVNGTQARTIEFLTNTGVFDNTNRGFGVSIRCIKD